MKIFRKRINEIMGKFVNKNLILYSPTANFFGQESKKTRQIRGNGMLILMENKVYFEMWKPKKTLEIPIDKIFNISTPKSYLKKSKFRPLLKIHFKNDENENDSAAWLVKDLNNWRGNIKKLMEAK